MNGHDDVPQELPIPLPWCKFPSNLLTACKQKKIPADIDKRSMINSVADWIIDDLKDTRTGVVRLAARSICSKHPQSFADRLAEKIIGDGVESLVKSIANRISYILTLRKNEGRPTPSVSTGKSKKSTSLTVDTYGTVASQPGLPPEETAATQQRVKEFLLTQYPKLNGRDQPRIDDAMETTYPSQRIAIMTRKSLLIGEVLEDWPFLREPGYFIKHAAQLVGKRLVFNEFVANVAKYFSIHQYMGFYVNEQKKKLKNEMTDKLTKICEVLKQSSDAATSLNESFPQAVALIPLLLTYFNEENEIYRLVEVF